MDSKPQAPLAGLCAGGADHEWREEDTSYPCKTCGQAVRMWCTRAECCGVCCGVAKAVAKAEAAVDASKVEWLPFEEEDGMWMPFKPDSSDERSLAPLVNTPLIRAREMIEVGRIGKNDCVVDLGCGGGEILCEIALLSGAKRCIGMEIDKTLIKKAGSLVQSKGLEDRVSIIEQNIVTADLSMATILVIFLTPWAMELLSDQLERSISQGARVISYWWPAVALEKRYLREVGPNKNIYLYGKKEPPVQ